MSIKEFIQKLDNQLPEFVSIQQLVDLGIFSSRYEACRRRSEKRPPEFLHLSERRIVYPKQSVISWLQSCANKSNCEAQHDLTSVQ